MITAKYLKELLGVEDNQIILHGYSFARNTLCVYFEGDKLIRVGYYRDGTVVSYNEQTEVDGEFFYVDVKRWYENGTNPKLRDLCSSLSTDMLPETAGGSQQTGSPVKFAKPEMIG